MSDILDWLEGNTRSGSDPSQAAHSASLAELFKRLQLNNPIEENLRPSDTCGQGDVHQDNSEQYWSARGEYAVVVRQMLRAPVQACAQQHDSGRLGRLAARTPACRLCITLYLHSVLTYCDAVQVSTCCMVACSRPGL